MEVGEYKKAEHWRSVVSSDESLADASARLSSSSEPETGGLRSSRVHENGPCADRSRSRGQ
jgi:hypothetical protein